ncbi:polysaccharide deacetylase family protein [Lactobacillus sp. DCY120]|uniref:Polysaccharide deacetylase family protein n=1 Tax=Bombilactobacillus apium TaxID=2675299 RepID=A0A850R282_9LACO|nr:polysaccharide deacetylase family protein [Bombilactobacillus apium]NVY96450.1 polysaccharide deacetylase family protein [Bombilactobacillus apium]
MKKTEHRIFFVVACLLLLLAFGTTIVQYHSQKTSLNDLSTGLLAPQKSGQPGIMILSYRRILKPSLSTSLLTLKSSEEFHRYLNTTRNLKKQLAYLRAHHVRIISLEEALSLIRKRRPLHHQYVVLTVDGADQTIYDNWLPIMRQQQLPFTIFVTTGSLGDYQNAVKMMSWKQLQKLFATGLATVGSKTDSMNFLVDNYPALTAVDFNSLQLDFQKSIQKIKRHLHVSVRYFAYPFGYYNQDYQKTLVKDNFITFSLKNRIITSKSSLSQPLPRISVDKENWNNVITKWIH